MDKNIKEEELNDFEVLKRVAPKLRLVCFNGQGAAAAEEWLNASGYETRLLPSSSPANTHDRAGRERCRQAALNGFRSDT